MWPSLVALVTERTVVRVGAALYGLACLATFVVPNPLGANITRLGMFVAAPVVVLTARRLRSRAVVVALPALVVWQWSPAFDGIVACRTATRRRWRATTNRSSRRCDRSARWRAASRSSPPNGTGRPSTSPASCRWRRGWERQLDMGRNDALYGATLDADTYHRWLLDNAVQFVALADVAIDPSARLEAELVGHGLPFLEPVWHDAHWRLWRVVDPAADRRVGQRVSCSSTRRRW